MPSATTWSSSSERERRESALVEDLRKGTDPDDPADDIIVLGDVTIGEDDRVVNLTDAQARDPESLLLQNRHRPAGLVQRLEPERRRVRAAGTPHTPCGRPEGRGRKRPGHRPVGLGRRPRPEPGLVRALPGKADFDFANDPRLSAATGVVLGPREPASHGSAFSASTLPFEDTVSGLESGITYRFCDPRH